MGCAAALRAPDRRVPTASRRPLRSGNASSGVASSCLRPASRVAMLSCCRAPRSLAAAAALVCRRSGCSCCVLTSLDGFIEDSPWLLSLLELQPCSSHGWSELVGSSEERVRTSLKAAKPRPTPRDRREEKANQSTPGRPVPAGPAVSAGNGAARLGSISMKKLRGSRPPRTRRFTQYRVLVQHSDPGREEATLR